MIRAEPEWSSLPANLHGRLREVIERCLEKDSKDRCHDISDVRMDIQKILADPSGVFVQPFTTVEPRRRLGTILPWFAASVVIASIIVGLAVWRLKPTEPRQVIRFDYELPEGQQINGDLAISPDGKQFVYSTSKGLYLRSVDESTAKLIAGTEGAAEQPFFSPDGKWVGYWSSADHKLKKISVSGGAPIDLCNVGFVFGASWGADNMIVYGQLPGDIMRISANGGTPESLVKAESGMLLGFPQVPPDGKSVLFNSINPATNQKKIMVQSVKSGVRKELVAGNQARYLPTRHLVYQIGK